MARTRRSAARRCVVSVLAAGATLAAVCLGAVADPGPTATMAAAATPSPTSSPNAPTRVKITLDSLEPKVAGPSDTLTLDGVLLNTSGVTLNNVSVVLRVSTQRIGTRSDLDHDADANTVIGSVLQSTQQILGVLAPGDSVSWHIALPMQRLGLPAGSDDFGVYPIEVEAGTTTAAGNVRERTRLPTFLTWMPTDSQFVPTQISWLWPLVDGIHRSTSTTFTDDTLARDLAPTGRVGSLLTLAAAAPVPITYALDPALVDDATVMAAAAATPAANPGASSPTPSPQASSSHKSKTKASAAPSPSASPTPAPSTYQVTHGGTTTAGVGTQTAATFLAQLKAAVGGSGTNVIGLPYGNADMVALDRAGLDREIDIARSTGLATLSTDLDAPILPGVVWPVDGFIDESTLSDLAGDLVSTVVLQDSALPPRDPNAVPGARTDLQTASGPINAVLSDSALDALVADPSSVQGGVRAAEQLFLAQTMLITEQRPGAGSSVVIAPPQTWTPNSSFVQDLLADSGTVPWLKGVNLSAVASQPADGVARGPLVYPDSERDAELPTSELQRVGTLRQELASFASILGSSTTEPFLTTSSTALLRAESVGLRGQPTQAAQIGNDVQAGLESLTSKVTISNPKLITLTSHKNKIPITVVNNLPDPITISIQVVAANSARLKVEPVPTFTVDGGGTRHTALITVEPRTSGRFEATAQLLTPESPPQAFGTPIAFEMNSTAYGTVALAIAGGAAALLFLLSAIRLVRRFRRHRRRLAQPPEPARDAEAVAGEHVS
jgi:hypothetical protein